MFRKVTIDEVIARHTEEFDRLIDINSEMMEAITGEMTDRERKIFAAGFGAGYMQGADHEENGVTVEVLD